MDRNIPQIDVDYDNLAFGSDPVLDVFWENGLDSDLTWAEYFTQAQVYTLTGEVADTFFINGQNADLLLTRRLTASPDTITANGQSASLKHVRRITATPQTITVTPQDADLRVQIANRTLTADVATLNADGQNAGLFRQLRLIQQAIRSRTPVTGQNVALKATRRLTATNAAATFSASDVRLDRFFRIDGPLIVTVSRGTSTAVATTGAASANLTRGRSRLTISTGVGAVNSTRGTSRVNTED